MALAENYGDLFADINKQIQTAAELQARAISGQGGQAGKEATAKETIASQRYGITGSPTATALAQKVQDRINMDITNKQNALKAQTAQQQAQLTQGLGVANIQDKQARDMAFQQMIGNIVTGLGSTAGTLLPKFIGA